MSSITRYSWVLLFAIGLVLLYYAYDNIVVIPAIDPADPERGWDWLTADPQVIEYIKFWFRIYGIWVLAVAVFVLVISATGYRLGQRWAWFSLLYLPVHIAIHMFIWPWTIPILAVLLVLTLLGLFLPLRIFFPRNERDATP
jgi:hypothetical protein